MRHAGIVSLSVFFIVFALSQTASAGWFHSDWTACRDVGLGNAPVVTLTNFTYLINVTYDTDMLANFTDLRFTTGTCQNAGANLSYEFDTVVNSNYAWVDVNLPSLADTGTTIAMYYGNAAALDGQNTADTWDNEYVGVWHMNDLTTSFVYDSSGKGNNLGKQAANEPIEVSTGVIGKSQRFDGSNDHLNVTGTDGLGTGNAPFTMEGWFNKTAGSNSAGGGFLGSAGTPGEAAMIYLVTGTSLVNAHLWDAGLTDAAWNPSEWDYVVYTFDGADRALYVNGKLGDSDTFGAANFPNNNFIIGERPTDTDMFGGEIDEYRLSNISRPAAYVNQTYEMYAKQSSLVSFGSEQTEGSEDGTPPVITINAPTTAPSKTTSVTFNFSVTDETNSTNMMCWKDVGSGWVYLGLLANGTSYQSSETGTEGSNTWQAACFDGYQNGTDSVTFDVDTTAPVANIDQPAIYNNVLNVSFSFTAYDATSGVDDCWYSLDGVNNISLADCSNTTLLLGGGQHLLSIYVNDSVGWVGSDSETFYISGLNISIFDNDTGTALSDWTMLITNTTGSNLTVNNSNRAWFGYDSVPQGTVNITIDDGSYHLFYFNASNTTVNNRTNYRQINISLEPKPANALTLGSSPAWSVDENTEINVSCTSSEGTVTMRRDGIVVSNPFAAVLPFGTYTFNCTIWETDNYAPASTTHDLSVMSGGFGCLNSTTYAFSKTIVPTTSLTTFNFTYLVGEHFLRDDLKDVYSSVQSWKNLSDGYYFIVNTTGLSSVTVYFGNYIANNTHSDLARSSDIINITTYTEQNAYYLISVINEITGESQLPPNANTTVSLICSQGTSSFWINTTSLLVPTFDTKADEIKATVVYSPTEQYSRNLIVDNPVEYKTMYLVDAEQNQVAQLLLSLNDQTGEYSDSICRIKKQMEGTLQTITENYFDAENKVILYLISGDKYQVYVDNLLTERNIGYLYIDPIDLTKTITIGSITTLNTTSGNLSYTLTYVNTTHAIYFAVRDPDGYIGLTQFWVYNYSGDVNHGLLYYANSTNVSAADFTYIVPDVNGTYLVRFDIKHDFWGQNSIGWETVFNLGHLIAAVGFPISFPLVGTLPIAGISLFSSFMIIGLSLTFGQREAKAGLIITGLFVALFAYWGWFEISGVLLIVVLALAFLYKMTERKVEA